MFAVVNSPDCFHEFDLFSGQQHHSEARLAIDRQTSRRPPLAYVKYCSKFQLFLLLCSPHANDTEAIVFDGTDFQRMT